MYDTVNIFDTYIQGVQALMGVHKTYIARKKKKQHKDTISCIAFWKTVNILSDENQN